MNRLFIKLKIFLLLGCCFPAKQVFAQTDIDAIMMEKNGFCVGPMYSHTSWKNYWEGTLKRDNLNLAKVCTSMDNYGISNKLNVLIGMPYLKTKAFESRIYGAIHYRSDCEKGVETGKKLATLLLPRR